MCDDEPRRVDDDDDEDDVIDDVEEDGANIATYDVVVSDDVGREYCNGW